MGNICASSRNKECLYGVKHPDIIKKSFNDCIMYTKTEKTKSQLKKKKKKLMRKINNINDILQQRTYVRCN